MYQLIIADDEPLIRAGLFYRPYWNAMGFEVAAMLEDGSEVLDWLEKHRADVLLADIRMYQTSGLEAAKVIHEKYPWMKVVLLSGYKEFEYAREAMRYGVYEYLLKPVDYDRLQEVFEAIRQEFDRANHEEALLRSFGQESYEQALNLIRGVADSMLGEGEEVWIAYAYLKPVLNNAPPEIREVIVRRLLELLQGELARKDETLAEEFRRRLSGLELNAGKENDTLSRVFVELKDELIARNLIPVSRKMTDDSIAKACNYIRNHLGNVSYQEAAEFVHLSPRHFIRRFRNETGETFSDYVTRVRMESAVRLLQEGEVVPDDVGETVGYHDEKYFQKLFREYTGMTLREFVRRRDS